MRDNKKKAKATGNKDGQELLPLDIKIATVSFDGIKELRFLKIKIKNYRRSKRDVES